MSITAAELDRQLTESEIDVTDDMRRVIVEAAERLAEAVERLRASLEGRQITESSS